MKSFNKCYHDFRRLGYLPAVSAVLAKLAAENNPSGVFEQLYLIHSKKEVTYL